MKKIFMVLLALLMFATPFMQLGAMTAEAASETKATTQYKVTATNKPTIIVDKGFTAKQQKSYAEKAQKTMNMIPASVLKTIKGVTIYIVNDANDYYSKSDKVYAFYKTGSKKVYISASNLIQKNVLLHELGHAFDYCNKSKSKASEFQSIFKVEKSSSSFQKVNYREYFADAFASYVLGLTNSSFAKRFDKIPKTKAYIKKVTGMGDLKK